MTPESQITPRRVWGVRLRLLLAFVAVVLVIVLLAGRGARESMMYYVTVGELLTMGREADAQGVRVTGTVVPGTIDSGPLYVRFKITDGTTAIPVEYRGVVPDAFAAQREVVVEGSLRADGTFEANLLIAKCPSKYEAAPGGSHPEEIPRSGKRG